MALVFLSTQTLAVEDMDLVPGLMTTAATFASFVEGFIFLYYIEVLLEQRVRRGDDVCRDIIRNESRKRLVSVDQSISKPKYEEAQGRVRRCEIFSARRMSLKEKNCHNLKSKRSNLKRHYRLCVVRESNSTSYVVVWLVVDLLVACLLALVVVSAIDHHP